MHGVRRTKKKVNELNIEFPVKLFELMSDISKNTLFIQASTEWVYGNKVKVSKKIDSYNLSEKNLEHTHILN